ncbi:iron complex outermembrane receptor protein [Caballeronia udeis]|uniref:Iron complex outermembrane receptor protein n=1 Tax=Caballeronia udeis TaxID=1232866 RepID=A0ABW8MRA8_9BURK
MARQQSERRGVGRVGARGRAKNPWRLAPIAAAVFLVTSAFAQTDAVVPTDATGQAATSASPGQQLPAVVVKGQRDAETGTGPVKGYVAKQSTAGTKTDTPIIKTPQAISVVTRDQMDIQDAQSVAQALRYTSGINPEQRGTNTDSLEYLYARGFLVDEFWNGLRTPGPAGGFGFNVTSFDPYMFERIELLHGPASVLYGQGSPGGTVNLVSKMPTAEPLHEVGFQTGSYGRLQGFFDFSGPIDQDGKVLYRLTADGFNTATQTDYVNQQRFAISPTITWKPTKDTTFTVFANYQADPEAGIYNSVPAVGTILTGVSQLSRSFYPGEPTFDSFRKTQESIGYQLDHRLNDIWSFKQSYRFLHNSQTVKYVADDLGYTNNGTELAREAYLNSGRLNSHTLDNQASARFNTGPVSHTATVGVDYQNTQFDHVFYGSSEDNVPSLSITNPQYGQSIPYPTFMFGTSNKQSIKQLGTYAQDQIDIYKWSFLLGVREDWTNEDTLSYKTGAQTSQFNRAFTWRAGGVYKFDNGFAPYVSYTTSFQPQVGTTLSGTAFVPTTAQQYEVGVKYQPTGYNSFVTVSAFHLTQQNVLTTDPTNSNFQVQTGEVRSQGFEVEAHASLTSNLQLIFSYTYTNLLNTKSNTSNLDKVPVGIPRNTASLWADYTVTSGLLNGVQAGAGLRYIGGSYGDTANSILLSSATLVDLALRYDLGRAFPSMHGWTASLNASNLLNRAYMASCSNGSCYWGQGRLVLAGLKYQW